jgi:rubrerythrin
MAIPGKKFWRCNVCNDIHYGRKAPDICPTCGTAHAYVEVAAAEAKKIMA